MLSLSNFSVQKAVEYFAEYGVEAVYLVPTRTGLWKGYCDATKPIRTYFANHGIHDYDLQEQGPKVRRSVGVVTAESIVRTRLSLYRPRSKDGDPRIWVLAVGRGRWKFQDYAEAGDLIAFFTLPSGELFLVNVSKEEVFRTRHQPGSPLHSLLNHDKTDPAAQRVLAKLRSIAARGYIDAVSAGNNAVGVLLESLLGIRKNSNKTPDIDGIEIKGKRVSDSGAHRGKDVLFGERPDWSLSPLTAVQALDRYGYVGRGGLWRLANTQSATPNSQFMYLRVLNEDGLVELVRQGPNENLQVVFRWSLEVLESRLSEKHPKTFWTSARHAEGAVAAEAFHYVASEYTRDPMTANVGPLIAAGKIVLELSFKRTPSGGEENHGFNWRMSPSDRGLLFPPGVVYDLLDPE